MALGSGIPDGAESQVGPFRASQGDLCEPLSGAGLLSVFLSLAWRCLTPSLLLSLCGVLPAGCLCLGSPLEGLRHVG